MNPLDWINSKLSEFLSVPARLDRMYAQAQQIFEAEARYRASRGVQQQSEREKAAIIAMVEIDTMRREWRGIRDKLVVEERTTLGQTPLTLIVVGLKAITAAIIVWAITALLRKASVMEQVVDALADAGATPEQILEAVKVTPQEQSALATVAGAVSNVVMWVAIGAFALFVVPQLIGRKR